jgi:hypothetical protein
MRFEAQAAQAIPLDVTVASTRTPSNEVSRESHSMRRREPTRIAHRTIRVEVRV